MNYVYSFNVYLFLYGRYIEKERSDLIIVEGMAIVYYLDYLCLNSNKRSRGYLYLAWDYKSSLLL